MASGEFIGFLDHDDQLLSNALYEVVLMLNRNASADFIYSDEILISKRGKPVFAYFRPDFSLDYMLSHCYIVHFVVIRASILKKIGGFRAEFKVSQDYDLFLRVLSQTRNVLHIPKILYGWRQYESSTGHLPEEIKVFCAVDHSLDSLSVGEVLESSSAGLHHLFLEQMTGARFVLTPSVQDFGYVQDISGLGEDP